MNLKVKTLEISRLNFKSISPPLDELSGRLDLLNTWNPVDEVNWKRYDYKPVVNFIMAYTDHEILLKYRVKEKYFKAEKTESNQNVYEDSCVEFFVLPEKDGVYYNLEFNGIGTCLMGVGTGRHDRERVVPGVISLIRRWADPGSTIRPSVDGMYSWELTIAIPLKVFYRHSINNLTGKTFRVNFFKCGDMLEVPHYLTWNPVLTPEPDYHRPEFFGLLKFV